MTIVLNGRPHDAPQGGTVLALLEAMFAGCPIVASEVGEVGVALAHGEAGILVEPGQPAALAAALDRLLSDPDRARELGEHAVRRAAAEYDISRMVQRYAGVYEALLGRRRPLARAARAADASLTGTR